MLAFFPGLCYHIITFPGCICPGYIWQLCQCFQYITLCRIFQCSRDWSSVFFALSAVFVNVLEMPPVNHAEYRPVFRAPAFGAECPEYSQQVQEEICLSKKKNQKYRVRSSATAYLMLLPAAVLAFLFILLPILYSLGYAFTNYYLLTPNDIKFIGFDNFVNVFKEIGEKGTLYHAIINTLIFVVGVVPLQIGMALGLALFTNRKVRGVKIFKVC